jgi:hypothetical protein
MMMSIAGRALIAATGIIGLTGSVLAADMTGSEIKSYISGKSIYLQTSAASSVGAAGQAVIYFAEDGTGLYKTPSGAIWHGAWQIKGNTLCTDWKERPNNPCIRYDKTGNTVSVLDAASGQVRAKIVKVSPGNSEKLTP